MELFERVKKSAALLGMSESKFAAALGVKQSTFAGYLTKEGQHKLWKILPRILQEFPDISRQWLYFEEGPPTFGRPHTEGKPVGIRRLVGMAESMAEDCGGSWGELLRIIAGRAKDESDASPDLANRVTELEKELAEERSLNRKLTARLLVGNNGQNAPDKGNAAG